MAKLNKKNSNRSFVTSAIKNKLNADFNTSYLASCVALHDAISASQKRLESSELYDTRRGGTRWTLFASDLVNAPDELSLQPIKSQQTIVLTRSEPAVLATLLTMKDQGYPLQIIFNHSSGRDLVHALSSGLDSKVEWVMTADEPLFAGELKSKDNFVQVLPLHPSPQTVLVHEDCTSTELNVLYAPKDSTALSFISALNRSYPRSVGGLTFKNVMLFDYSDWAYHAFEMALDDALVIWNPAATVLLQQGVRNTLTGEVALFKKIYGYNASVSMFANTARLGEDLSNNPDVSTFLLAFVRTWRTLAVTPKIAWKQISTPEVFCSLKGSFTRLGNEITSSNTIAHKLGGSKQQHSVKQSPLAEPRLFTSSIKVNKDICNPAGQLPISVDWINHCDKNIAKAGVSSGELVEAIKQVTNGGLKSLAVSNLVAGNSGAAVFLIRRLNMRGQQLLPLVAKVAKDPTLLEKERNNYYHLVQGILPNAPSLIECRHSKILLFEYAAGVLQTNWSTLRVGYQHASESALAKLMTSIVEGLEPFHIIKSQDTLTDVERMPLPRDLETQIHSLWFPDEAKSITAELLKLWEKFIIESKSPCRQLTMAHGDLNAGNIMFEPQSERPRPVFIDFASMRNDDGKPEFLMFWDLARLERDLKTRCFLSEVQKVKMESSIAIDTIIQVDQGMMFEANSGPQSKLAQSVSALREAARQTVSEKEFMPAYLHTCIYAMVLMLYRKFDDKDINPGLQRSVACASAVELLRIVGNNGNKD